MASKKRNSKSALTTQFKNKYFEAAKELEAFNQSILNRDNTFLNNIDDDFISMANNKSKKKVNLSLANRKSSSGVSTLGSPEYYELEKKSKRQNDALASNASKKLKLKNDDIHESGVSLLEDTLDSIDFSEDFSKILEQRNKSESTPKAAAKINEFDAFQNIDGIFALTQTQKRKGNSKAVATATNSKELDCPIPKQVNEVENEIKIKGKFKIPIEKNCKEGVKSGDKENELIEKLNSTSRRSSNLFDNKNVALEYRKDVDNLFEQIEHSICLMGTNKAEVAETNVRGKNVEIPSILSLQNIDWTHDNIDFSAIDASFGSAIKNALLLNAAKTQTKINNSFSLADEDGPKCGPMGPFYGLPLKVKEMIKQFKGIDGLYDWQDECLRLPAIEERKNLIYALPTSGGKTLVAEILILREIICFKRNALLILPFVAIVQEKVWALSPFAVELGFLVEEYAASKGCYPPKKRRRKNSVYIATIEKALGLINSLIENGRLSELGLIIVDELHLLGDGSRGGTLEALLTKLMILNSDIQIIGMSATIGNLNELSMFLNADIYSKNFRPVELLEYVKCGNDLAKIDWNSSDADSFLIETRKLDFKYTEATAKLDPDMLGGLVMEVIPKDSCLIFCATKKNCENIANLLCKVCSPNLKNHRKTEKANLLNALRDETGAMCSILKTSVQFGVAYHHSGLTGEERKIIEDGFRAGTISVICCTSTLAAGVNLPARRVIVRSPYIGRDFINLSRYKQMVGRAGRAGLGEVGESILITTPLDLPKVRDLLMSPMNNATSKLHLYDGKGLRHLLLSCVSLGIATTREDLHTMTEKTLMAVQANQLEVNLKEIVDGTIKSLYKLSALEIPCQREVKSNGLFDITVKFNTVRTDSPHSSSSKKTFVLSNKTKLVISDLGRAAIKGGLELTRAHMLYEDLLQAQSSLVLLDCLHLLYLVTPYDMSEQIRPNKQIYYDIFSRLGKNELQTAKILGLTESVAVRLLSNLPIRQVSERVLNRFYLTLLLYDLWNEMPVFQASHKYQVDRGIVQNLMTNSASFASNVVNFCEELNEFWAFSHLLKGMSQRLSHCCIRELAPLMELPSVKQNRAKQLYNAGYKTLQSIAKANVQDLVETIEFMSRRVAGQLIAASKMLLLEKIENLREEAVDILNGVEIPEQA